ncbi:MAG: hypothetical protein ACOCZK_01740 [Planctomycetota bacterium]
MVNKEDKPVSFNPAFVIHCDNALQLDDVSVIIQTDHNLIDPRGVVPAGDRHHDDSPRACRYAFP